MADRNNIQKFCLQYYNNKNCSNGEGCGYPHKARYEVEPIAFLSGADFLLGNVRKHQRVCHFFRKGNCIRQNSCMYLHDNDSSTRNGHSSYNNLSENTSISEPCTSSQASSSNSDLESNYDAKELRQTEQTEKEPGHSSQEETPTTSAPKKEAQEEGACASPPLTIINTEEWVKAPEFYPKYCHRLKSYAEALSPEAVAQTNASKKLCPFASKEGFCRHLGTCQYVHGDLCDMCERFVLHPYNEEEKKRHRQDCLKQHEKNMELSFAVARSKEKSCGVCFEVIMEKATGEQRFGILPNCNHCFCLTCIRKWRQARQFENKIIRACPECRVTSDFVCPSSYWVDTKEDKDKLIEDYKKALSKKDCKYFKRGEGKCPFGNKCFYLHAFPDGSKCDVGPPPRQRRVRSNVDTDIGVLQVMLWDFLDERDFPWQSLADDLEDIVSFFTDSDESDWSDYELFLD